MKKSAFLSILLCAVLLLQCAAVPVSAAPIPFNTETVAPAGDTSATEGSSEGEIPTSEGEPVPTAPALPFGRASIENGCRTIEGLVPLDGSDRFLKTAAAAFVYETTTRTVIYNYNPDMKVAPGTLTKIVTALLAIELCDLDQVITVDSANIARLPGGSQNVDLRNGEQLTVRDLLYCLILHGANDAAIVLAEHISGSLQGFVVLMNERVKKMGCTATEFANVHGLENATATTSARDIAKIMLEGQKNEDFRELFGTTRYTVPETSKRSARELTTQNYMMDDSNITKYIDERVTGGMQSYVSSATGASNVVTVELKNGLNLICVVMGASRVIADNGWSVLSYGNFDEMTDLIDYVNKNFKRSRILYDGQALEQFPVLNGESQVVAGPKVDYDSVLRIDCQMDNLIKEYSVVGGGLTAPIAKGDKISTVAMKYRSCVVAEAELFAMNSATALDSSPTIHGKDGAKQGSPFLRGLGIACGVVLGLAVLYLTVNAYRRSRAQARRRRRRAGRRRSN